MSDKDYPEIEQYSPHLMEWGIINEKNYTNIYEIPVKRWDPLSTVSIKTKEFGLQEKERYYGHYSYISPIRAKRPSGFRETTPKRSELEKELEKEHVIKDVFLGVTEGEPVFDGEGRQIGDGFTLIITEDEMRRDNPFSDTPHRIQPLPEKCKAVTLINRYPSMVRIIEPRIKDQIMKELPKGSKLAHGINLVTISRNFYPALDFESIPEEILHGIFLSMKVAIIYAVEEAINRDYYDIIVTPFFNIGNLVGGSQPRIHSQVYIDLTGDGHGSRFESHLKAFKEMDNKCHLCTSQHGEGNYSRMVLETKYWIYFMTGSPIRNYHLRFHPKEHIRRFSQLNTNQLRDLAKSLKMVFKSLDDLNIDKNRNIIFNCCPYGYDADFHMFGDIIPHEIIGGAEMADDMRVARKLPEENAKELRNSIVKFYNLND